MRPSSLVLAFALLSALACTGGEPQQVVVPVVVPVQQPSTPADTTPPPVTPTPTPTPKPRPKPPPEPIPPAPPGAKPDIAVRDVDLQGDTVTFDLVNRGGELPAGTSFGLEIQVTRINGEGRQITVDQAFTAGIPATTSLVQKISIPSIAERFPRLAMDGGELDLTVTADTAKTVDESDESNNAETVRLRFDPPPATPTPPPIVADVPPVPPPAPTTATVTFRRADDAWSNVWVDGKLIFEAKNFETEQAVTLTAGPHRIKSEDFMGSDTWSEGTLTVTAGKDLIVGYEEKKPFDCYTDPSAFHSL